MNATIDTMRLFQSGSDKITTSESDISLMCLLQCFISPCFALCILLFRKYFARSFFRMPPPFSTFAQSMPANLERRNNSLHSSYLPFFTSHSLIHSLTYLLTLCVCTQCHFSISLNREARVLLSMGL